MAKQTRDEPEKPKLVPVKPDLSQKREIAWPKDLSSKGLRV